MDKQISRHQMTNLAKFYTQNDPIKSVEQQSYQTIAEEYFSCVSQKTAKAIASIMIMERRTKTTAYALSQEYGLGASMLQRYRDAKHKKTSYGHKVAPHVGWAKNMARNINLSKKNINHLIRLAIYTGSDPDGVHRNPHKKNRQLKAQAVKSEPLWTEPMLVESRTIEQPKTVGFTGLMLAAAIGATVGIAVAIFI